VPGIRFNVYRSVRDGRVGVSLSPIKGTLGHHALQRLVAEQGEALLKVLGDEAYSGEFNGIPSIYLNSDFGDLSDPQVRTAAIAWLADRTNRYVNVMGPAIRAVAAEMSEARE
jgi:hypothetical protein